MSTPKRHHYVPQMLLRRFTNEDGKLYCCRKEEPSTIFPTAPQKVFLESFLYMQRDEQGKTDTSVERSLADLEGKANEVIEKIVRTARSGVNPGLTLGEKEIWDEFLCKQWGRLPIKREEAVSDDSLYEKCLEDFEYERRPLTDYERYWFSDPKRKERIMENSWIKSTELSGGKLIQVLRDKGLCVAAIRNPKKSFVIGSNPIIKITPPGHTRLDDPVVEALLPIAYDVIVTPGFSRGEENLVDANDSDHIRQINEAMFRQSDIIAGRSHELIRSLSRRESTSLFSRYTDRLSEA